MSGHNAGQRPPQIVLKAWRKWKPRCLQTEAHHEEWPGTASLGRCGVVPGRQSRRHAQTYGWQDAPRGSLLSRLPERERPHGSLCSFLETTVQRVKKSHKMIVECVVVKPKLDDSLLTQLKP